jgi:hypothetical protein
MAGLLHSTDWKARRAKNEAGLNWAEELFFAFTSQAGLPRVLLDRLLLNLGTNRSAL